VTGATYKADCSEGYQPVPARPFIKCMLETRQCVAK